MIKMKTSMGEMTIELDYASAPKTCDNFEQYVKDGFYDGTIFHRVIDSFMIQGGGFEPGMQQKSPGTPVVNEADNGLKNDRGTISMARTNDPHSATAQFFLNIFDNASLNHTAPTPQGWGYCVFGKLIDGIEVMDAIRDVETGQRGTHGDVPVTDVIIETVTIES